MSGSNGGGSAYAANSISQNPKDRGGHGPALNIGSRKYQKTGDGNCN